MLAQQLHINAGKSTENHGAFKQLLESSNRATINSSPHLSEQFSKDVSKMFQSVASSFLSVAEVYF